MNEKIRKLATELRSLFLVYFNFYMVESVDELYDMIVNGETDRIYENLLYIAYPEEEEDNDYGSTQAKTLLTKVRNAEKAAA